MCNEVEKYAQRVEQTKRAEEEKQLKPAQAHLTLIDAYPPQGEEETAQHAQCSTAVSKRSTPKPNPYLTPAQLAARWNKTVGAISMLRHRKVDPDHIRIGRTVRYPLDAVIAYEKAHYERNGE